MLNPNMAVTDAGGSSQGVKPGGASPTRPMRCPERCPSASAPAMRSTGPEVPRTGGAVDDVSLRAAASSAWTRLSAGSPWTCRTCRPRCRRACAARFAPHSEFSRRRSPGAPGSGKDHRITGGSADPGGDSAPVNPDSAPVNPDSAPVNPDSAPVNSATAGVASQKEAHSRTSRTSGMLTGCSAMAAATSAGVMTRALPPRTSVTTVQSARVAMAAARSRSAASVSKVGRATASTRTAVVMTAP